METRHIKILALLMPGIRVKGDGTNHYASTIAKHLNGEWSYNINWKPDIMPDVDAAWIRAIDNGQKLLENGTVNVPVLLLHSDKSARQGDPKVYYHHADAVLNVQDIAAVGRHIGRQVEEVTIRNGLHDLVLSDKAVREEVYRTLFRWLENE